MNRFLNKRKLKYTNSSHRNGDESYQSSCREMNDHFGKTIDKICSSVTDGIIKNHLKIDYAYLAAFVRDTFIFLFIK